MTVAHLVLAILSTGYILTAIQHEERDLIDAHQGDAGYRKTVPMLIPRFKRGTSSATFLGETA